MQYYNEATNGDLPEGSWEGQLFDVLSDDFTVTGVLVQDDFDQFWISRPLGKIIEIEITAPNYASYLTLMAGSSVVGEAKNTYDPFTAPPSLSITYEFLPPDAGSGLFSFFGGGWMGYPDFIEQPIAYTMTIKVLDRDKPDLTPPVLVSSEPEQVDTDVPVDDNILFSFDEKIKLNDGVVEIYKLEDGKRTLVSTIPAGDTTQVSVRDNVLVVNPKLDLDFATQYAVSFGPGVITDMSGNSFGGISDPSKNLLFTTEAAPKLPDISVKNVNVAEGNSSYVASYNTLVFEITLSEASTKSVTVDFTTSDGTALKISDYLENSGKLTFAPGEISKTVEIKIVGDLIVEPTQTFQLTLSNAENGNIATASAEGRIFDDDTASPTNFDEADVNRLIEGQDGIKAPKALFEFSEGVVKNGGVLKAADAAAEFKDAVQAEEKLAQWWQIINRSDELAAAKDLAKTEWKIATANPTKLLGQVGEAINVLNILLTAASTYARTGDATDVPIDVAAKAANIVAGNYVGRVVTGAFVATVVPFAGAGILGAAAVAGGVALGIWAGDVVGDKIESWIKTQARDPDETPDDNQVRLAFSSESSTPGLFDVGSTPPEAEWEFNVDTNTLVWLGTPDPDKLLVAQSLLGAAAENSPGLVITPDDLEPGDAYLRGGIFAETYRTGAGNDVLFMGKGDDVADGGAGDDGVHGQDGNDELDGGDGNDVVEGGAGHDTLRGSGGQDLLHGEEGNDFLFGGQDRDILLGGTGDDELCGEQGDDELRGGEGNDVAIWNGDLKDYVITKTVDGGFMVTDTVGSDGVDMLYGVERARFSDQEILLSSINRAPEIGKGIFDQTAVSGTKFVFAIAADAFADPDGDLLSYSAELTSGQALPSWLVFDAKTQTFSGTPFSDVSSSLSIKVTATDGTASVSDSFQLSITGGRGPDITGTSLGNWLIGTGLGETVRGLGGNDTIKAGAGNDMIFGGTGRDYLWGEAGADIFAYSSVKESPWKAGKYDVIEDFNGLEDKIDLSAIDANINKAGNQAFKWQGYTTKYSDRGELDYWWNDGKTFIFGYTDKDQKPEFYLSIDGKVSLDSEDFVL